MKKSITKKAIETISRHHALKMLATAAASAAVVPSAFAQTNVASPASLPRPLPPAPTPILPPPGFGEIKRLLFHGAGTADLHQQWTGWFRESGTQAVGVVTGDGILCIGWPTVGARRLGVDLILATATRQKGEQGARSVAAAWIGQNDGHEEYFFKNVENKIRNAG